MRQSAISFSSQGLDLEGVVSTPQIQATNYPMVVICHSHPIFDGNMNHPLLLEISRRLDAIGIATLRFNFRGIGSSGGEFTNGRQELADVKAALRTAIHWPNVKKSQIGLVGYSFGAAVIIKGLTQLKQAKMLGFISPPTRSFQSFISAKNEKRANLFIVGADDRIANARIMRENIGSTSTYASIQVVEQAGHTWVGKEPEAAQHITRDLTET